MASSFYTNTLHVDFESVLAMDNPGMVSVFNALMASGLEGFLGCPAVLYEAALVDFFENGSVRDGLVVSTMNGVPVEITEQLFTEAFELPVDGLSELSKIPKDKVFDARSLVSLTGEPVSTSGKKSQMKIEYRLLCDIMAKTISVKTGSFNAITTEKFLANGNCLWIADAPEVKRAPVQRAMSKNKPAAAAVGAPEAVPIQIIEPIPTAPTNDEMEEKPADEVAAENVEQPADEVSGETIVKDFDEPAVETTAEEIRTTSADDLDIIIKQVIADIAQMGSDAEDHGVGAPEVEDQPARTTVGEKRWFDLPYEDIFAQMDADRPVVTPSDTDEEMETIGAGTGVGDQQLHSFVTADSRTDAAADYFVEEPKEVEMSDD
ncbi:hypothetical protein F511_43524 [Dorcoceras hygrometricum]|uniref:Dystroglycan-like n=1 Tax=Dorcoceras hygrometricum TaxID=472368 RepID=A0A2Z7CL75_9LAMI|nr:hypothetical protein F511_43524 [Dorcoceras hygrometricum]